MIFRGLFLPLGTWHNEYREYSCQTNVNAMSFWRIGFYGTMHPDLLPVTLYLEIRTIQYSLIDLLINYRKRFLLELPYKE